jgi:hypothetical protein
MKMKGGHVIKAGPLHVIFKIESKVKIAEMINLKLKSLKILIYC